MSIIKDEVTQKLADILGFPSEDITFYENGLSVMLWAIARISRLKNENDKMKKALEFYADANNYFVTSIHANAFDPLSIYIDKGKIAHEVLKELKYEILFEKDYN